MKIKLLLETIKIEQNEHISFSIHVETKGDIAEVYKKIEGIVIQEKDTKEHLLLSSEIKLVNDRIFCIVPINEFLQIIQLGYLKLSLRLDKDLIFLNIHKNSVSNYFFGYKDKFIQFNIRNQNSPVEVFIKKPSDIKIYVREMHVAGLEKNFKLKGEIHPKFNNNEFCIKECFLKNETTNEIIQLDTYSIDYLKNEFILNLELGKSPLYEGEWSLNILGVFNGTYPIKLKANYLAGNKDISLRENGLIGGYFGSNNQLFYHKLSVNSDNEIIINLIKNNKLMVSSNVEDVVVENNKLKIVGSAKINVSVVNEGTIDELIFINRGTGNKKSFSLKIINDSIQKQIPLEKVDFFEDNGIWDVFLGIKIYGVSCLERLNIGTKDKSRTEDFVTLPKTIYNEWGSLKRIRFYSTLDKNLALLVRDEVMQSDISRIDFSSGKIIVKGSIRIPDVDYVLKDIYLEDPETHLRLNCINKFFFKNDKYLFKSAYDWDFYNIEGFGETEFKYFVEIRINESTFKLNLVSNTDDILNKSLSIIYPALHRDVNNYPMKIHPYYSRTNELYVSVSNYLEAFCNEINVSKKNIKLLIQPKLDEKYIATDIELLFKNYKTGECIKAKPINKNNKEYEFCISENFINSNKIQYDSQWDIYLSVRIQGNILETRILAGNGDLLNKNSTFKSNSQRLDQNSFFSIFFDKKNKRLFFEIRDLKAHEKISERIRFLTARGIAKIASKFLKRPVWLVGENLGEVAQDNGFAFFEFCIKNNKPEKHYYVSTENNKNKDNLRPYTDKILKYNSFKHLIMYCLSQYLIVSHGIRDVIPSIVHNKMGINPKSVIYLQHGIIAMKKLSFNKNSYNGMIKKFVVSSLHEQNILINEMKFNPKQVMVTGLSRFDSLVDRSKNNETRIILLMPTWRDWVVNSREEFLTSNFYKHYNELLQDSRLHSILENNNLILKFFPHIEIQKKYKNDFKSSSERVQIVELGKENIKDLIQNSSLMITDYSSVVFDFGYLEKPIIFYQFDIDEYLKFRGSYVDLREDLIGDTAYTKDEVIKHITEYIENDFRFKPKYQMKSKKYFDFIDKNNSQRIYDEIKKLSKKSK